LLVEGHAIGLDCFCPHEMLSCGHYERDSKDRQVS
jgi:hypothetical protein